MSRPHNTTPLRGITDVDRGWLAGLIEGEGSFSVQVKRVTLSGGDRVVYRRPIVQMRMTDEDVIRRVHRVVGVGSVNRSTWHRDALPNAKVSWGWLVSGYQALQLMILLYPLMGTRRQQRMEELLQEFTLDQPSTRTVLANETEAIAS